MNINHNFETITEGKVYKSGVPPDEIAGYVRKHIKSIVDLRMPGTDDLTLNPEKKYRQKRMLSKN
jgi:hypothetical protein